MEKVPVFERQLRARNESVQNYHAALGLINPLPLPQLANLASLAADLELDIAMRLASRGELKSALANLGSAITLTRNAAFHLSNFPPPTAPGKDRVMPSDPLVTAAHVLKAVMELDRRGSTKVVSELEASEPDLAEHLLENLTRLFHHLTGLGLSGKDARKAYRRAESTALVCVMALRQAYRELSQEPGGTPVPDNEPGPTGPTA